MVEAVLSAAWQAAQPGGLIQFAWIALASVVPWQPLRKQPLPLALASCAATLVCGLVGWQPTAWQFVEGVWLLAWHAAQPGMVPV